MQMWQLKGLTVHKKIRKEHLINPRNKKIQRIERESGSIHPTFWSSSSLQQDKVYGRFVSSPNSLRSGESLNFVDQGWKEALSDTLPPSLPPPPIPKITFDEYFNDPIG